MVQEYLDIVKSEGDVRLLMLNGDILGAMRRKPFKDEFRTNIHVGGQVFKHEVTPEEKKICRTIKKKLIADGLFFVGVDLIGDKLVEINCVNPGGIPRVNRLNTVKLESKVIYFIERKVKQMKERLY